VTSDPDIWRCANVMVKRYGEGAALEATHRADAMLEKGDMDGRRVWKRILKAIEELERTERTGNDAKH